MHSQMKHLPEAEQYDAIVLWGKNPGRVIGVYPGGALCLKEYDKKKKQYRYRKILPRNVARYQPNEKDMLE